MSLGFEPAWFNRRCGVDFSERWHRDPIYRHETLKTMKVELHRAFPTVGYWDTSGGEGLGTVSGVYGGCLVPHALAFEGS